MSIRATRTPAPTFLKGKAPCPRCGLVFFTRRYRMCRDCREVEPRWGR